MGMRDSLITSSTWQTKFKKVLEKYPVLSLMGMDFAVLGCDACNLGARMSKVVGRVSGEPYDRFTFEVWNPKGAHVTTVDAIDRSPLKILMPGNSRIRNTVKTRAKRGPRNRCTWDGSAPSGLNHFTSSRIGR